MGRAAPPAELGPAGRASGPPGRSSGPPGRSSGPPARPGPGVPPGSSVPDQPQRASGVGIASVGRGLYRAEHRASVAPPGDGAASGDGSVPSTGIADLTIGSRSSGGSQEQPGHGNGNGNGNGAAGRGGMRGARVGREILCTRPENLDSKKGTSGQQFTCITNYYKVLQRPNWTLTQYR